MNTKKYLTASVSGFIVMFILGWIGHELILSAINSGPDPLESVMRSEPNIIGIAVAYLILALLMAYIYPKGVEEGSKLSNGLKFGIIIGLIFELPMAVILYSILDGITISMVLTEGVWHMIEQGIGGIAIAYAYGASVLKTS